MRALGHISVARPTTLRQQVRDGVRTAIVGGRLKSGDKLPSTHALAAQWGTRSANVHAALNTLVKEGWLVRKQGLGTVVSRKAKELHRVMIYSMEPADVDPVMSYERSVIHQLMLAYHRRGIEVEVFVDPRPREEQDEAPPQMVEAVSHHRIQAIVTAQTAPRNLEWLRKLPVVGAFITGQAVRNAVTIDNRGFITASLRALARRGCRRAGFIVASLNLPGLVANGAVGAASQRAAYAAAAAAAGLKTRPDWIVIPERELQAGEFEAFGHQAWRALRQASEQPDGLVVFSDVTARGVLLGIAEAGIRVPDDLRLALHRNAEVPYYCPFPATFVQLRTRRVAEALIDLIDRQYRGEAPRPVRVSFEFSNLRPVAEDLVTMCHVKPTGGHAE